MDPARPTVLNDTMDAASPMVLDDNSTAATPLLVEPLEPPGSPVSILRQKRRLGGRAAHDLIGVKSRRVEDQSHAPPLVLAERPSHRVEIRRRLDTARGPHEQPPIPPTLPEPPRKDQSRVRKDQNRACPEPLGRHPSFRVAPQPAQPHITSQKPAGLRQQPSFEVILRSSNQPAHGGSRTEREEQDAQEEDDDARGVEAHLLNYAQEHSTPQLGSIDHKELQQEQVDQPREQRRPELQLYERRSPYQQHLLEQHLLEQQRLEQQRLDQQLRDQQFRNQQALKQQCLDHQRLEHQRLEQQRLEQRLLSQQDHDLQGLEQHRHDQERLPEPRGLDQHLQDQQLHEEQLRNQQRLENHRLERERLLERQRLEQQRLEQRLRGQQRLEQQQRELQRLEQQCFEQQRLEQQRLEQQRREKEELQRLEQQRLELQRLEQQRLEQQRLEQQRLEQQRREKEELQRLEQQRLEQEELAQQQWLEQRKLQQEQQIRDYQHQLEASRRAVDTGEIMDVDSETAVQAGSRTSSTTPRPQASVRDDNTTAIKDLFSPLPFQTCIDHDPPPTYKSPAKDTAAVSSSPNNPAYRVPSPTFPAPAPALSDTQATGHATAQLISLLLQQGERTNQLMETLVRENRELRSAFTVELKGLRLQLDGLQDAGVKCADHEEEGQLGSEDDDDDDDEELADDERLESQASKRRASKQQKKLSVFKNPKLKPALKYLQGCVRQHLFFLFDVKSVTELVKKNPPFTDEEMDEFINGDQDSVVCSVQHFRVDFQRPWKENAFNKLAKDVFVKSFLALGKSGEYRDIVLPPELLTERVVGTILDSHMEYRRKNYREHLSPLSEEDKTKLLKRKAMNSRRYTLRESRVSVILEWKLDRHKKLFAKLRPIHMSGDETDDSVKTHPPTFRIVEARWQSHPLKTFMRTLDSLYRRAWAKPVGNRATSGNPPRCRVERTGSTEDGVAPIGLWRNCYDKSWLRSLRPHVRESLNIIDSDYDFSLTKDDEQAQR